MSEVPDLVAVSDLLQDLSVQLRRLNVRQDGESRLSPEPGWVDVPSGEELNQDLERIEVEFGAAVLRLSTLFANRVSSRREVITDEVTEQLRLIRQLFRDQQHITSLLYPVGWQ